MARLMREQGVVAKMDRRYKPRQWTAKSKIREPNLLKDRLPPSRPSQVWVADFTYLNVQGRTRYLSVIMDLCTRQCVAYEISKQRGAAMVMQTLKRAIAKWGHPKIFHSDRGTEYANHEVGGYLDDLGIQQSMSGKGNCYDNAHMESFFHSYKTEVVYPHSERQMHEIVQETKTWLTFYNRGRIHSGIGYTTPENYARLCA